MSRSDEQDERPAKRARLSPFCADADVNISASTKPLIVPNTQADSTLPSTPIPDDREMDVGISEYASDDTISFQAILKKRYTDFLVNEILPNGEVVHLTDVTVPKALRSSGPSKQKAEKQATQLPRTAEEVNIEHIKETPSDHATSSGNSLLPSTIQIPGQPLTTPGEVSETDKQQLISYLNETAVNEILALYKAIQEHPNKKPKDHPMVRTEFTNDRTLRGEIHRSIRRIFNSKIDSSTGEDGVLCLTAINQKAQRNQGNNNSNNNVERSNNYPGKLGWVERGGEYLHFSLYKENKDTMEAVGFLVRNLRTNPKIFQFAGTKDRRACTVQRLSAYRLDAERLVKQNHSLRNAAVGNFEYKPAGLELGDLSGNEFVLTLRECVFPKLSINSSDETLSTIQSALDQAVSNLYTKGFLNYFGLQRFGTFMTRTDATGLLILKGDFRAACEGILRYDASSLPGTSKELEKDISTRDPTVVSSAPNRDEIARAESIQLFQKTGRSREALEMLPRKFSAENQVMRHLGRTSTDYFGALTSIPRNLRMMYVHAYQSFIWNKAVSNRWKLYGNKVVEGDLVLISEHRDNESTAKATSEAENTSNIDADGEIIIAPSSHDRSNQPDDIFDRGRALTAAEASSGQYTIFDIVLPLPGYDIIYPANAAGQFYKDFMGSDEGGNLDPYDMRRKQKDFSLSGGYRKIVARIGQDFSVQVKKYQRDDEQFVQTDLEKVNAAKAKNGTKEAKTKQVGDQSADSVANGAGDVHAEGGSEKIAVVLKFQLGSSQYATMALRELSRGGVVPYKTEFGGGK